MICNLAIWDRALRFFFALMIFAYAVAGGPFWFYILGLYLFLTAGFGLCAIYTLLRIRTYQ